MSVDLSPSGHLGFHRPLTQLVKVTLLVSNPNHQPVAFKVKTTAPKSFCVRPNSGRIEPGERVEVQVLLQPMKEEPAPDAKCRDKFLVQSAIITPDRETRTLQELWSAVEAEAKAGKDGAIFEQKIRCVYLPPMDEAGGESYTGAGAGAAAMTPSMSANDSVINGTPSRYETVRGIPPSVDTSMDTSANGRAESPTPAPTTAIESRQGEALGQRQAQEQGQSILPQDIKVAASNAASAVTAAAGSAAASLGLSGAVSGGQSASTTATSSSDTGRLQQELRDARAEIDRLKRSLADKESEVSSGLRQRNVGGAAEKSGPMAGVQTAVMAQDGVPLPMVGAIAFGVFFFTWLFF